ncbi:uncharacterized protein LOC129584767 isoform X2 [Paramacrobiotus metropolitanus]|uniref:uncharacterized protein LOC129584767 isoform X2 n=1 Tax=Paramacrobiotus metropolitanus TaxID=2943436 RepID=UPI002445C849|nr:uncharacterized protein LOC129584767 isoform X2 [Paramacrobiotus metropolitanus]
MNEMISRLWEIFLTVCLIFFPFGNGNIRYLGSIMAYGSGDTMLYVARNHGGPNTAKHKWNMECLDGEGMVGVHDWQDDFERIQMAQCKFLFPYKPPSHGLYPYFSSCVVRNYTGQFFCFDPQNASLTMNTFVTGLWDDDYTWFTYRSAALGSAADNYQPYKCCKVPNGYYIDYVSCYYVPTHDQFREFYDAVTHQIQILCGTGYVMTGLSKKLNPVTQLYNLVWIQCCRVGYGPAAVESSPIVYGPGRTPVFVARDNRLPTYISENYQSQYRSLEKEHCDISMDSFSNRLSNKTFGPGNPCTWSDRYKPAKPRKFASM